MSISLWRRYALILLGGLMLVVMENEPSAARERVRSG